MRDGAQLVFDAWPGDPRQHEVLFLHGFGQTRQSWGTTASRLSQAGYASRCVRVEAGCYRVEPVKQGCALDGVAHRIETATKGHGLGRCSRGTEPACDSAKRSMQSRVLARILSHGAIAQG